MARWRRVALITNRQHAYELLACGSMAFRPERVRDLHCRGAQIETNTQPNLDLLTQTKSGKDLIHQIFTDISTDDSAERIACCHQVN